MKWWWLFRFMLEILCVFHLFGNSNCHDQNTDDCPFNSLEIVYPEAVLVKRNGNRHPKKIIFVISSRNQRFRVAIKQHKNALPINLRVYRNREFLSSTESDFSHCYYDGKLKGIKHSTAMMNTCYGLHGIFEDNLNTYYIEPWEYRKDFIPNLKIIKFPHKLYNMSRINLSNCSLQCKYNTDVFSTLIQSSKNLKKRTRLRRGAVLGDLKTTKTETTYLQLYLVNDYSMYLHYGKNATFLEYRSELIAGILNARFRPLNLKIILVGVEIWTTGDRIKVTSDAPKTLKQFMTYREKHINKKQKNDNAQLITRLVFSDGTSGEALTGTICSPKYSAAINQDPSDNPLYVATVLGHEIGHNIGMHHDEPLNCTCPDHPEGRCIMSQRLDPSVKKFSTCSVQDFQKTLGERHAHCLFDSPTIYGHSSVCGNKITEEGEACDCGSPLQCSETKSCCNPFTCQYFDNNTCISGPCCEQCQFRFGGSMCRNATSECDLPEYCSGTSSQCPPDVYLQNAYACANTSGSCYNGTCFAHDIQCQSAFGPNATKADDNCYKLINTKGDETGYCEKERESYKECHESNALCGKLQCSVRYRSSISNQSRNKVKFKSDNGGDKIQCYGILNSKYLHKKLELVLTGTKCGDNKICVGQKCLSKESLNINQCPLNCSNHGVCNSNNNCHCDIGWSPPLCNQPGYGGSIDSGQPLYFTRMPSNPDKNFDEDIGVPLFAFITMASVLCGLCVLVLIYKGIVCLVRSVSIRNKNITKRPKGLLKELLDKP